MFEHVAFEDRPALRMFIYLNLKQDLDTFEGSDDGLADGGRDATGGEVQEEVLVHLCKCVVHRFFQVKRKLNVIRSLMRKMQILDEKRQVSFPAIAKSSNKVLTGKEVFRNLSRVAKCDYMLRFL